MQGTQTVSSSFFISSTFPSASNLAVRPTDIRIISEHEPLISGSQAEFVCRTQGSRPAAEIMWFLEDIKLTNVRLARVAQLCSHISFLETILAFLEIFILLRRRNFVCKARTIISSFLPTSHALQPNVRIK